MVLHLPHVDVEAHGYGDAYYHKAMRATIGKKSSVGTHISSALQSIHISYRLWSREYAYYLIFWELTIISMYGISTM